ncbi:hypothetical protein [Bacillus cereus]|uniref:hypothetical protein n=1 Tax=Bacillus cereus TaxID=1396 RepID=UPI000BF452A6|nr:hypothetical protein [Bacillus cereus]PFU24521.1 hypothetical protein COK76_15480 [Bacillus cereus]
MKFIGMSTGQSSTKARTKESLLRLQEMGYIEIYEEITMESMVNDLKPANNYFIKPTGKEEEYGFMKVFNKDIQKIVAMKRKFYILYTFISTIQLQGTTAQDGFIKSILLNGQLGKRNPNTR